LQKIIRNQKQMSNASMVVLCLSEIWYSVVFSTALFIWTWQNVGSKMSKQFNTKLKLHVCQVAVIMDGLKW